MGVEQRKIVENARHARVRDDHPADARRARDFVRRAGKLGTFVKIVSNGEVAWSVVSAVGCETSAEKPDGID
ncbi:hypothetical protein [Sphingomonas sp. R86520]|uniref:hypothetical protein n=1 Tax=Sphingomonas sp. R86520 TaxID=3093859 RepID=UPI0036D2156D